jgi:hypothetical protein
VAVCKTAPKVMAQADAARFPMVKSMGLRTHSWLNVADHPTFASG